jgi:predicted nucleotidyltransferase
MNLPSYFKDFLAEIEPSPSYKKDQQEGHAALRKHLAADEEFRNIHINTFLQGSYKRNTAIHPGKDVDIVVVTSLDPEKIAAAKANALLGTCIRKYYKAVTPQDRSFCVDLSYVTMDVVIAASLYLSREAEIIESARKAEDISAASAWAKYPILIPDRKLGQWVETHPKAQIEWTSDLNAACGGYFVPLVKMFKWWRQETYKLPKYPKGYLLERLVGECIDRSKRDNADGFVQLLENLQSKYSSNALLGNIPHLPDPGVPTHNVAHRLTAEDFGIFLEKIAAALPIAREALKEEDLHKSVGLWRKLFGEKFPAASTSRAGFPPIPVRPNKPAGFALS